ncbi:hypothetical protein NIES4071_64420 [Calothrix sp. NIES-4071]|nr:hypothetical protein NIES4071_64420 [Calothrix sp. NIES-4071]BAZ60746.1 hypothetical protein NIES4105_64380 [Calothrix sp. NIES-4105]
MLFNLSCNSLFITQPNLIKIENLIESIEGFNPLSTYRIGIVPVKRKSVTQIIEIFET